MAVNCAVDPKAILELPGVMVMDVRVGFPTVNEVVPEIFTVLNLAVIVTALALAITGVATPLEPGALLIFATALSEEFQSTKLVRFCVVLSE